MLADLQSWTLWLHRQGFKRESSTPPPLRRLTDADLSQFDDNFYAQHPRLTEAGIPSIVIKRVEGDVLMRVTAEYMDRFSTGR